VILAFPLTQSFSPLALVNDQRLHTILGTPKREDQDSLSQ